MKKFRTKTACIVILALVLQIACPVSAYAAAGFCETEDRSEASYETEDCSGASFETVIFEPDGGFLAEEVIDVSVSEEEYENGPEGEIPEENGAELFRQPSYLPLLGNSGDDVRYDGTAVQTAVKDQGSFNTCWAFSVTAAAEASMISSKRADGSVDYSEHGLAYFMYHSPSDDPLGLTGGDRNELTAGETYFSAGGNPVYALMMLSGWQGMQDEERIPYSEISTDASYEDESCYTNEAILKQGFIYNIRSNPELVKKAVVEYGGATVEYYMNSLAVPAVDGEGRACIYQDAITEANHSALIIGWDDDFPRESFGGVAASPSEAEKLPAENGAWLVKNSFGEGYGKDGYVWLSYEDAGIGPNSAAFEFVSPDTYGHNYHYDGTAGNRTNVYESTQTGTMASGGSAGNIFRNTGETAQLLEAVSIGIKTANTGYSVQIYTNTGEMKNPTDGTPALVEPVSGTTSASGLYCVELPEPVYLPKNIRFSVVVTLTNARSSAIELFTDKSVILKDGDTTVLTFVNETVAGQSFVRTKATSSWADWAKTGLKSSSWTFRIKAFTTDTETREEEEEEGEEGEEEPADETYPEKVFFQTDEWEIRAGKQLRLVLSYTPADRTLDGLNFTWESDDADVATVKKNGVGKEAIVTAKGEGCCFIRAVCREKPGLSARCYIEVTAAEGTGGGTGSGTGSGTGGGTGGGAGGGSAGPGVTAAGKTQTAAYSKCWYQGTDGNWYLQAKNGQAVRSSWVCDDTGSADSGNVWYLLGADGKMVDSPLVQDLSGNFYSLEMKHEGYYGMLRFRNGYYDLGNGQTVYLEFEQSHNGAFGAIRNAEGIEALKKAYGIQKFEVSDTVFVYTSSLEK